jgi:hypothetical protein
MAESVIFDEKLPGNPNPINYLEKNEKKISNLEKKFTSILKGNTIINNSIVSLEKSIKINNNNIDNLKLKLIKVQSFEKDFDIFKTKKEDDKHDILHILENKNTNLVNTTIEIQEQLDIFKKNMDNNQEKFKQKLMYYEKKNNIYLYTNFFLTICIIGSNYFRR